MKGKFSIVTGESYDQPLRLYISIHRHSSVPKILTYSSSLEDISSLCLRGRF
jgi:hypothetical protein